ncbi:sigma-54-dependent Fis family transcriptional regulator [Hyunsoonleella sp. SJ7]|uniref:Sigma-54-dependent Fis family transcriptional regulator n=1 Tax=Hyunsoonleella aquatilis TaxID=2762758 RepID=A0A923HBN3_9FLAO|nr:sigma-54 dependent transcriptional regulator [Hyunsoonleella aquatilis]MBC3758339.1 sigma-54-dependent Fis family transcriptional regulator [Hyunsoonleella aquatilis]
MLLKNANILVVDDDADVLTAMRLLLKSKAKEVVVEKNPVNIVSLIQKNKFDIIILDMNFNGLINTGNEGIYWLNKIRSINKEASVILITAYGDLDLAIRSLKEGASDFIVKPWKNDKLIEAIGEILDKKKSSKKSKKDIALRSKTEILGESKVMEDVFFKIKKIAPTDANILILGENGTGKDLIAKAIHENSLRKNKPFVKVDIGALTESLFESELFGYKKGAFTDAREDRKGRFETANGGTLFLDEIGNINLQQQARLLTVIQNRQVTPLGSNKAIPIDIRLICATNVGIDFLADEANFRKDLIYRINTVEIVMPPLRHRGKDVVLLAKHFVELYAEKYLKSSFQLDTSFIEKLKSYHFPGNVRELQYALERAVIMAEGSTLYAEDLVFSPIEKQENKIEAGDLKLETIEKNAILKVLEKNNGNISHSAKELGITRTALYRRLNKYGL